MDKITPEEMAQKYNHLNQLDHVEWEQLLQFAEQYAAQQVKAIEKDRQKGWAWSEKLAALKDNEQARAEQAEKKLSEVTRQRDELKEKVLDILPRLVEGCRDSYYFHGIKEIDQAHDLISQLENEKKDGE